VESTQNAVRVRRKKQILVGAAVVLGLLLVLYAASLLLERLVPEESETAPRYHFYEPDWTANAFEDADYAEFDRTIYLNPYGTADAGETVSVDEQTVIGYGEPATLLYRLVNAILLGDAEAYNSFFTVSYLQENGAKEPFTMQKLYDVRIGFYGSLYDEKTATRQTIYRLEYKIFRNDGTFRDDVGSDMSKAQHFVLVETADGYRVDQIVTTGA
jgi:hypothetical protein